MIKSKDIYIYLTDKYIYIKIKEIKKYPSNNSIKNNKINSNKDFNYIFLKILKENNINNNIFGDNINIIVNFNYTEFDKEIIKQYFIKYNFKTINIIEIKLNNMLEINNNYINYYGKNNLNIQIIDNKLLYFLLKNYINNEIIYVFGDKEKNDYLIKIENKLNNKIYLMNNQEEYIMKISSHKTTNM